MVEHDKYADLKKYCESIMKNGAWADRGAIIAITKLFKVNIVVLKFPNVMLIFEQKSATPF